MSGVCPIDPLGIAYGTRKARLPPPKWVVNKITKLGATRIMLCVTDTNAIPFLDAIIEDPTAKSRFKVVLGVVNSELEQLARATAADAWINTYVVPYKDIISHVCVGDLSHLTSSGFRSFTDAIHNIGYRLPKPIKVSTMVDVTMLVNSDPPAAPYTAFTPPSKCMFSDQHRDLFNLVVVPILKASLSPLFATIIPYFQMSTCRLPNSNFLINPDAEVYLTDGRNRYKQVYDAMLDAVGNAYAACRPQDPKVQIKVVTGWPAGPRTATANPENQRTYIENLRGHINAIAENYIYGLLDEENNPRLEEEWKHFGIATYP